MGSVMAQGRPNVVKLLNTVYGLVQYSRRLSKQIDDVNDRSVCIIQCYNVVCAVYIYIHVVSMHYSCGVCTVYTCIVCIK